MPRAPKTNQTTIVQKIIPDEANAVIEESVIDQKSKFQKFVELIKRNKRNSLIVLLALCVLGYFYYKYYNSPAQTIKRQERANELLVKNVSKFILLPNNEKPIIYKITDAKNLSTQQLFFRDAIDGDELLVYSQSQKAIIYSPERKILINVGPITFDNSGQQKK